MPGHLSAPRDSMERPGLWRRLHRDSMGQMTVEWVLVTTFVILPLAMTVPGLLSMIRIYFYRISGVLCLPFP